MWRALPGAGGAAIWLPRLGAGRRGTGPRGQRSAPHKYGGGCSKSLLRAWPAPYVLFPTDSSHIFWWEWGAARLHPHLFCPSERGKESSIMTSHTCPMSSTDPKGEYQAGGKEGAGGRFFHQQRLLHESWKGTLYQQTQALHTVCRAGAAALEGFSKAASQTTAFCLPLHTKPQLSPVESSLEAPSDALSLDTVAPRQVTSSCATGICHGSVCRLV